VIILGRATQGAGAIAAAVMAMTADLTREEHRIKAMAIIGMGIGMSFLVALIVGPALASVAGLSGIFLANSGLAVVALLILHLYLPTPVRSSRHRDVEPIPEQFSRILRNPQLLRLDAGILLLHLIMTALFLALPLILRDHLQVAASAHSWVYAGVLTLSVALMIPAVIIGERHRKLRGMFVGAITVLAATLLAMGGLQHLSLYPFVVLLVVFFAAFNVLEAFLPSLVSRFADPDSKGTAMGVYSTSQFLGAFLGGVSGGALLGHFGPYGVLELCGAAALVWVVIAAGMRPPSYLSSHMIHLGDVESGQAARLSAELAAIRGVAEAVVVAEDGVAYLKIDRRILDNDALLAFSTMEG
jgi:predicted MFS family arabinose efflux permease